MRALEPTIFDPARKAGDRLDAASMWFDLFEAAGRLAMPQGKLWERVGAVPELLALEEQGIAARVAQVHISNWVKGIDREAPLSSWPKTPA